MIKRGPGLCGLSGILLVCGCASLPVCVTEPVTPDLLPVISSMQNTDWLNTLFILGAVLSFFGGLNGLKVGWLALLSCVFGLVMKAALSNVWVYTAAGLALVLGLLVLSVSLFRKHQAIREIVTGVQNVKCYVEDTVDRSSVNEHLAKDQSRTTQAIVRTMKGKP